MNEVVRLSNYLAKAGVFYLATIEGDQPKVRPLGFQMVVDDVLYFGVGDYKDVYKQLVKNPKLEICATIESEFVRYYGEAEFVDDENLVEEAFKVLPMMKKIYNERTGNKLKLFRVKNAVAEYRSMLNVEERIEF